MIQPAGEALAAIDWTAPWLASWRALGEPLQRQVQQGMSVAEALNAALVSRPILHRAGALRFVAQTDLPAGTAYEAHIAATGQVPTRNNRHDFFNGLAWLRWPALKLQLNILQAEAMGGQGGGATRGALRDGLTLFDENALLLQAPPPLLQALQARDWPALFGHHRGSWPQVWLQPFGHALLDKLCAPRKPITAHVWCLPIGVDAAAWLARPEALQALLAGGRSVLPVLGVPGWWPANEAPCFYDDAAVFRPPRVGPLPAAAIIDP